MLIAHERVGLANTLEGRRASWSLRSYNIPHKSREIAGSPLTCRRWGKRSPGSGQLLPCRRGKHRRDFRGRRTSQTERRTSSKSPSHTPASGEKKYTEKEKIFARKCYCVKFPRQSARRRKKVKKKKKFQELDHDEKNLPHRRNRHQLTSGSLPWSHGVTFPATGKLTSRDHVT